MKRLIALLTLAFCMLISAESQSQEKVDTLFRVETKDGNEYVGTLVKKDINTITLNTSRLGPITIKTDDIKRITPISSKSAENEKGWPDNPQATKYFIANNGYGLKKGEGYYQNVWIFFNQFNYGVTNYFSVGVGIVPLFLFAGSSTPVWINPKFSIPLAKDKVNLGVGVLAGTVLGENDANFAMLNGAITFGSRDNNISIGGGWGVAGDGEFPVMLSLSGMHRLSAKWYLLSENYLINVDDDPLAVISAGARYATRKIGIDFGLVIPVQSDVEFFAGPWLGINVPFGRK